jgi:hypothetical protein
MIIVRYVGRTHSEAMDMADEAFWGRKYNNTYWAASVKPHATARECVSDSMF